MGQFDAAVVALLAANLLVGSAILAILVRRRLAVPYRRWLARRRGREALDTAPPRLVDTGSDRAREHARPAPTGGGDAMARARAFLRRRIRTGTYGLACVGTDGARRFSDNKGHVFVANFVTEALTDHMSEIDRALILARILSEEQAGQWGFSPPGPYHGADTMVYHVDADDTACVIRTLRRLGVNRAPECLLRYYRPAAGLFATFDSPEIAEWALVPSPAGNLRAHPEVNANVLVALRGTHLEDRADPGSLERVQDRSGGWQSYFYPGWLYGTQLALDALAGRPARAQAAERGAQFVAALQQGDGSWGVDGDPYDTALAVTALAGRPGHAAAVERGARHLVTAMQSDGSWHSPACIWEFHAAPGDIWRAYDVHRAYVTARCLTALRRAAGELAAFA